MIQINNKTISIILTILPTLLLLALPVQSQRFKLFPLDFFKSSNLTNNQKQVIEQSKFYWRYIEVQFESYKVLTVEQGNAETPFDDKKPGFYIPITPYQLRKKDGFGQGLNITRAYFNLSQFNYTGTPINVVTIEEADNIKFYDFLSNYFSPLDLAGTGNYTSELNQQTKFNWRNVTMIDGNIHRAVTLED